MSVAPTPKVITKSRTLVEAYLTPLAPPDTARLPDSALPRFCPFCASATLVPSTSAAHAEIGCWNGKRYCYDDNLPAFACTTCDGSFTIEPSTAKVHDGCGCDENSGCDCGRYQLADSNEYCPVHKDWQLAGQPCGLCKGETHERPF